jgi:hypothetical protein
MALLDTTWYVNYGDGSTTGYYASTKWAATTAKTVGNLVRQNAAPAVGSERIFVCIIAGTTLSSEPTWVLTRGAKTAEAAGPTWMECSGQPALCGDAANTVSWVALKAATAAAVLGQIVKDAAGTHAFICTTAGTISASEPAWNTSAVGNTTTDTSATWTYLGLISSFTVWGAPHGRLKNVFGTSWAAAGNTIFVGDNHAETAASATAITSVGTLGAPCFVLCMDHTVAAPTVSNLKTTATIATTGANSIQLGGSLYCYGVTFTAGNSSSAATVSLGTATSASQRYDSCTFKTGATASSNSILVGPAAGAYGYYELNACNFGFAATSHVINLSGGVLMRNCSLTGATIPTTLFNGGTAGAGVNWLEGCDWSAVTGALTGTNNAGTLVFKNCKLNASATFGTPATTGQVSVINSDSGGASYRNELYDFAGTQTVDTSIVRTGGASDGTTPQAWKIATTANALWPLPFEANAVGLWNVTTGANVAVTIECVWNAAAVPNNDDIWMDLEYMGTSGNPLGVWNYGSKATPISANSALTASTQGWDSQAATRANSQAYALGAAIKVSDNAGRVFFCTTAGTSAGSEPGGYASAVDGGSVTDGTAVFRAGVRFKLTATLSSPQPQYPGLIYSYIRAAKASAAFWVDPLMTLG